MMKQVQRWPAHLFLDWSKARQYDAGKSRESLTAANALIERGLAPVLSLPQLAVYCSVPYGHLRSVVLSDTHTARGFYRNFRIKKANGKYRIISIPDDLLKRAQRWILDNIVAHAAVHPAAFAYCLGRGPRDGAAQHCGSRWSFRIDVKNFFHSIDERAVYRIFHGLGYDPLMSYELSRICTIRCPGLSRPRDGRHPFDGSPTAGAYSIATNFGCLPQGSPTSPQLSNLAMRAFDAQMSDIAGQSGLVYTRYADDLVFSCGDSARFSRRFVFRVTRQVRRILLTYGLTENDAKHKIMPPGARQLVLGYTVDRDRPRIGKAYIASTEALIHQIKRFGPQAVQVRRKFRSVASMRNHVTGKVNHIIGGNPVIGHRMRDALNLVQW